MNIIIIVVAVTAGVILGGTAIYVYQGKWQSCLTQKQGKRHYMQDWNPDW